MKIATKENIYSIEKICSEQYGISARTLMENAGNAIYDAIRENDTGYQQKSYLVICGTGNNGEDGAVAARLLFTENIKVKIISLGDITLAKGNAHENFFAARALNIPIIQYNCNDNTNEIVQAIQYSDVIIDAIFGIGFNREPDSFMSYIFNLINSSKRFVISLDLPSGVFADGGACKNAIRADLTISFILPKLGTIDFPGKSHTGRLIVKNIMVPSALLENTEIKANLITFDEIKSFYTKRKRDSHKGDYGHLLIIGGFEGMSGAVILAGLASLRTGAGLVTIASESASINAIKANLPEAMTLTLDSSDSAGSIFALNEFIQKKKITSILIGNGFGTGDFQKNILQSIIENTEINKLTIDADGLNIMSNNTELLALLKNKETIATPHIGEMSRILHVNNLEVKNNKINSAHKLSDQYKIITVLKDSVTVISDSNGNTWINDIGSAALAKGGSGDILAGLIAGLHTSSYNAFQSAVMGCYLLGKAGQTYENNFSAESSTAREIINIIPESFREFNCE